MDNFTPLKTKHQKKSEKFFLIANIFLLLIVVFFTGYYMTQRLISTRQKAAGVKCSTIDNQKDCNAACSPPKANGKSYACKWLSEKNACVESSKECGPGGIKEEITEGFCSNNQTPPHWFQCGIGVGNPKCTFCLKSTTRTCNQVLKERGCGNYYFSSDGVCSRSNNKCFKCENASGGDAYHYKCDRITNIGNQGCQDNPRFLGNLGGGEQTFCFDGGPDDCGSEQIDWGNVFITRIGPVACNKNNNQNQINPSPTLTPTEIPTNTPILTPTSTPTLIPTSTPISTPTSTPTTPPNQPTNTPNLTSTNTPTPTEIIIAQTTSTLTPQGTTNTQTPTIPVSGSVTIKSVMMYVLPLVIIGLGIIL